MKNVCSDGESIPKDINMENELKNQIVELKVQIVQKQMQIDKLQTQIDELLHSRGYQITKPLRFVSRLASKTKMMLSLNEKPRLKENTPCIIDGIGGGYDNLDFSHHKTDIKPLALYLPQFHAFPENDEWWGEGFTEWTNVRKAVPRYKGHNQPRVPHPDIGYYNLADIETLKKQVALAKQHGIYGFAVYYYWFSGKRLMEKPMDMFLDHKEIDFPFMLIWANENWTRAWDGQEKNVLIKQEYAPKDAKNFIIDLKKYLDDGRYIRIDGKPVIGLYKPLAIPDLARTIITWRETARNIGIGEVFILVCATDISPKQLDAFGLFDGIYEFPPLGKRFCHQTHRKDGAISFDYYDLVDSSRNMHKNELSVPFFRGSMLEWDNSCRRRAQGYHNWNGYSPKRFFIYNRALVTWTRQNLSEDKRFFFINAWNEWGEGTYLEPDTKYGYAHINALSKAIFDLPYENGISHRSVYFIGEGKYEGYGGEG